MFVSSFSPQNMSSERGYNVYTIPLWENMIVFPLNLYTEVLTPYTSECDQLYLE